MAFIFRDAFRLSRVSIFHHFATVSCTVYNQKTSTGFIQGVEEGLKLNMMPDTEVLFAQPSDPVVQENIPLVTFFATIQHGIFPY